MFFVEPRRNGESMPRHVPRTEPPRVCPVRAKPVGATEWTSAWMTQMLLRSSICSWTPSGCFVALLPLLLLLLRLLRLLLLLPFRSSPLFSPLSPLPSLLSPLPLLPLLYFLYLPIFFPLWVILAANGWIKTAPGCVRRRPSHYPTFTSFLACRLHSNVTLLYSTLSSILTLLPYLSTHPILLILILLIPYPRRDNNRVNRKSSSTLQQASKHRIYLYTMATTNQILQGVNISGTITDSNKKILSKDATAFLALLHRSFNATRKNLLQRREIRQAELDKGLLPDFLPETKHIRENDAWKGARPAPGLVDRRVEITGPTDRKMVVNALNSNVWTYMADFEDSSAPTWDNMVNGQVNLYDAIRKQVDFKQGEKEYKLRSDRTLPTLIVRPRGWHLEEKHFTVDGEPISGSLFDFGLYFFHNAHELIRTGFGPYFYLPKLESHLEARLWNDVFNLAQDTLAIPRGTIRGTVLIETILAAFEMDEIIYELRDHSSGLNCGRWDYIFSVIKKFRQNSNFVLPDRSAVTMTVPFMDAYVKLLIQTCHRRQVHAMGGMAAQIPIKDDKERNDKAMEGVYADKLREVKAGHDGTWVAHPALAAIASEVFNKHMPTPNQMFVRREDVRIGQNDLLNMNVPGQITEAGIRTNLNIGLGYMEGWLRGVGCVPINYLMEDAATAEVSRSQLWQWVKHGVPTADGKKVDKAYALKLLKEQADDLASKGAKGNKYHLAAQYFSSQVTGEDYADFLTSLLYNEITSVGSASPAAKL